MKLLVVGVSGQVARGMLASQRDGITVIGRGRPDLDLEAPDTIQRSLDEIAPDAVACVGAYTAVDKAESEPERAMQINALGPEVLAKACNARDLPIVYVSTDYVFSGDKDAPYLETDPVSPRSVYGSTKLEGEQRVAAACAKHAIMRTAWVYSHVGANFVRTMLRVAKSRPELTVVNDQFGCPTYAPDLAEAIITVAQRLAAGGDDDLYGAFHAGGGEDCSWFEFAGAIFEESARLGGPHAVVKPVSTAEYEAMAKPAAKRPANSRLDGSKLAQAHGVSIPGWRNALPRCIGAIAKDGFAVD